MYVRTDRSGRPETILAQSEELTPKLVPAGPGFLLVVFLVADGRDFGCF